MFKKKFKLLFASAFLIIFFAKMGISFAPMVFSSYDNDIVKAAILQVELEHGNSSESKETNVSSEFKYLSTESIFQNYELVIVDGLLLNDFIEHYGRYVDPHHPSVPTPPPNFV